jgi:hypothetical protein
MGVSEGIDRMTCGKRSWPRTAHIGVAKLAEPTPIDSMGCVEGLMHRKLDTRAHADLCVGTQSRPRATLIDCL